MAIYSRLIQCFSRLITNPNFSLYFSILLCVHISNGLFYRVLFHIHCKQLGSQLAFYELIYVRPVFLKLGPGDDLEEVEICRPSKLNS